MKELSIEEKARAYDEAIKYAHYLINERCKENTDGSFHRADLNKMFPKLKESEDEKIGKEIITYLSTVEDKELIPYESWIAWLEKQGEQKPCMIQWKGDNLKEVIGFTGKDKNFEKWFKSFEEYERYVHEHNNIFKLFNEDGSHYEVPVGAWIVKTPDGYNVASKAVLKQKPTEWGEEDKNTLDNVIDSLRKYNYNVPSKAVDEQILWLKSLKDRIQSKRKWSAEDSRILYNVKAYIGYAAGQRGVRDELFKEANEWLNSLPIGFIYNKNYNEDMVTLLVGELKQIANDNNTPEQYQVEIDWLKSLRPQDV